MAPQRVALAMGRDAVITARMHGTALPPNPFNPATRRAAYWQWGVERAQRQFDQLMEIGA